MTRMIAALLLCLFMQNDDCRLLTPGESQVVERTNVARKKAGLSPLVIDCRLMNSSRLHAIEMAENAKLYHSSEGGYSAENIAAGQPNAAEAVSDWLKSDGHRANMLSPAYKKIGVAGKVGRDGRSYWVQQFLP
jgi:uncharacterized protein YkwD